VVTQKKPASLSCLSRGDAQCPRGANWFSKTCGNTEAHALLHEVQEILDRGVITSSEASIILARTLPGLRASLESVTCPLLSASAIQTLKRLAFVRGADKLEWPAFSVVSDIWRSGSPHTAFFDSAKFLEGWKDDIPYVQLPALPWYTKLLGCEGLPASPHFNGAVSGLVEYVEKLGPQSARIADDVAHAFVNDVLTPLCDKQWEILVGQIPFAARLVCKAAGDIAVEKSLEEVKGIWRFDDLMRNVRACPETRKFWSAHEPFNLLYRRSEHKKREWLEPALSVLIPKILAYSPRKRRRLATHCRATVIAQPGGGAPKEFPGEVFDLCEEGHGCHIKFDDCVSFCDYGPQGRRGIPKTQTEGSDIVIRTKNGEEFSFCEALVRLHIPSSPTNEPVEFRAFALRGFVYEQPNSKMSDRAGAVFWIPEEPTRVTEYRQTLHFSLGGQPALVQASLGRQPQAALPARPRVPSEGAPFGTGVDGILKDIKEWLQDISDEIHLRGQWQVLWNRGEPVEEKVIDAYLRPLLTRYAESRGGQVAPQADTGVGKCDYLICHHADRVFVELKPSYGRTKQGIAAELPSHVETIRRTNARAGLFLVLAFKGKFKPGSPELQELLQKCESVCRDLNLRIDIAVVDCDKPVSASIPEHALRPGEALQYYEGRYVQELSAGKVDSPLRHHPETAKDPSVDQWGADLQRPEGPSPITP